STNNGTIRFAQVDNNFALTVNTGGNTVFTAPVGSLAPLFSLTTDAPGNTSIAANVTTNGNQSYGDNVTLTGNATLTSNNNGAISFAKTIDGAFDLTVNTAGNTTFNGLVGATTPLTNLTPHPPCARQHADRRKRHNDGQPDPQPQRPPDGQPHPDPHRQRRHLLQRHARWHLRPDRQHRRRDQPPGRRRQHHAAGEPGDGRAGRDL